MDILKLAAVSVSGLLLSMPAFAGGVIDPQPCGFRVNPVGTAPAPFAARGCGATTLQTGVVIEPNSSHQIKFGVLNGTAAGANMTDPFRLCVPLPVGATPSSPNMYLSTSDVPLEGVTWSLNTATADANIQGDYCSSFYSAGLRPASLASGQSLYATVDVTYGVSLTGEARYFSESGSTGVANYCDPVDQTCEFTALRPFVQPIAVYNANVDGCGIDVRAVGATFSEPRCTDNPQPATAAAIEPNSTHQLAYGMQVAENADLGGTYMIRLPLPNGLGTANPRLYLNGVALSAIDTTFGLNAVGADANIQGHYEATYNGGTAALVPGDQLTVLLDVTFGTSDVTFVNATGAEGMVGTDCSQRDRGGNLVSNGSVCPFDNLQALTVPVKQYVARIDDCGFVMDNSGPLTSLTCEMASPQTLGPIDPNTTHNLTYGARVPTDADTATLGGMFSVCLPLPSGVTYANQSLSVTDRSGTTVQPAIFDDSSGSLCATLSSRSLVLVPGDVMWVTADFTFGTTDARFVDTNGQPGWVGTDCSDMLGNAQACPSDTLPDLTVDVREYVARIDDCGFVMDNPGPLTSLTCEMASPQTLGPVEPYSTHNLTYGARVPTDPDTATLGGMFSVCLPLPPNVTHANASLSVTNRSGTTVQPSAIFDDSSGSLCATLSSRSLVLEPGDVMWVTADFTFDLFDANFVDTNSQPGWVGSDCSDGLGNALACPADTLPDLTVTVKQYTAQVDGCGFEFYDTGDTPIPPRCTHSPAPQVENAYAQGTTKKLVYGMFNNNDLRSAATLAGNYRICLPIPNGVSYANETYYATIGGTTSVLAGRDVVWGLETAGADSNKQGDLCVTSRLPGVLEPGDMVWASVDITFTENIVTFGDEDDNPGWVGTDCSQGGGNASVCPTDNIPLLSFIDATEPAVISTLSSREITTSEDLTSDTVLFTLSRQPSADVRFEVSSNDLGEGIVTSPSTVTLTRSNWDSGVKVGVQGVNDDLVDGNITLALVRGPTASADTAFNDLAEVEILWNNADNDRAGIVVDPLVLSTSESGTSDDFTVVLSAQPSADVTIDIAGLNTTEGSLSTTSLTFDGTNWDRPQTVTVTGVDDAVIDGPVTYTLNLGPAQSSDLAFNDFAVDDVDVTNADNDSAGFTITTDAGVGGEAALFTNETGTTDTVDFVLNTQPTDTVTIGFSSSNTAEGTVSAASLVFDATNWDQVQTLTVTGVDDDVVDGTIGFDLVVDAVVSNDTNYAGIDLTDIPWDNADDDVVGLVFDITPGTTLTTTEAGGTDSFTVALSSQPLDSVTVPLSSSDATEGSVPASLVFTTTDWDQAQTVTVTGVDDALQDGDVAYVVQIDAMTSNDPAYDNLDLDDIDAINIDDDTVGVTVAPTSGTTTEAGGTQDFTVVLTSAPTADVTVAIASTDASEGTASTASLVFTSANWSTAQTVTVTGQDDSLVDGDIAYQVTTTVTSSDSAYDGFAADDVDLINEDDDSGSVVINGGATTPLQTTEAGGTDTFTVELAAEPTADVDVAIAVADATEGTVSTATVSFTAANWNTTQNVTVTGVDDAIVDGDITYTITLTATSSDAAFTGAIGTVDVENLDDDSASIIVTPIDGLETDETGLSDSFTVVLGTAPSADVTIPVASANTDEGEVSVASLTFTTANWDTPQTVDVTGVDDDLVDGDIVFMVELAAATSADTAYAGVDATDVEVTNFDDDGGDTGDGDTGEDIWVQGGCDCSTSSTGGSMPWMLGLLALPLLRRRRVA
ncbi:MAG: hypothetical protein KC912_14765 [Proteobacteria bacterium]|nr:hypothetical protein [Pseudomonadota bacterium]